MKPSLQLKFGQHLRMTPQLQQAIRLLQLSTMDLKVEIQETLESNPMLEVDEEQPTTTQTQDSKDPESQELAQDSQQLDLERKNEIPEELPVDSGWDEIYDISTIMSSGSNYANSSQTFDYLDNQSQNQDTLIEHLLWQLQNARLSEKDFAIGIAVIDAINDDGYLTEDIDEIFLSLEDDMDDDLEIHKDEVAAVLHLVQRFDPPGVAARDLRECLLLQLEQYETEDDLEGAKSLVKNHLDLLGAHDYAKLKQRTRLSEDKLSELIQFIQSLNPRPGSLLSANTAQYVIPDIFVQKINEQWKVTLNPEVAPKLKINPLYAGYAKNSDRNEDTTFMKNNLQEARWFIKSLQSRCDTLLKVGTSIVQRQRLFFEYGDEGMKPLILRDIAEELDMHESTISRVTTNKYMLTPKGIYEFKFFFSSHVSTADGGECSATAIRAMVKKLIENENPLKPMSDNKISTFLVKEGINVARRTVAKYRESMSIPPSNERKQLA